jgi:regulator of sigma E protease
MLHYPLAFFATLGLLVTIHEFGHYLVARFSGVGVVRFSVGFGRPLVTWRDRRGTDFTLAVFPLGGYVRMYDEREADSAAERPEGSLSYMELHPAWRVAIALGGPMANFLMAIVVYWALAVAGSLNATPVIAGGEVDSPAALAGITSPVQLTAVDGKPVRAWQDIGLALTDRLGETGDIEVGVTELLTGVQKTVRLPIEAWHEGVGEPDVLASLGLTPTALSLVGDLVADAPADRAGLQRGDFVVSVDGRPVTYWRDWVAEIQAAPDRRITLELYRSGTLRQLTVTPEARLADDGSEVGVIGVYPSQALVEYGPLDAVPVAIQETWEKSVLILSIVKKMITGQVSVKNLSGPISIAQVAGDSARYSWRSFVGILAFLSVSLGVFNLLPVPILDGGHVVFNTAELVMGKPVPERIQVFGVQVGLFLVGTLMVFATYNDLLRLF